MVRLLFFTVLLLRFAGFLFLFWFSQVLLVFLFSSILYIFLLFVNYSATVGVERLQFCCPCTMISILFFFNCFFVVLLLSTVPDYLLVFEQQQFVVSNLERSLLEPGPLKELRRLLATPQQTHLHDLALIG